MRDVPTSLEQLTHDIMDRLRPVCPGMSGDELSQLAESMAVLQLKYERRSVLDFVRSPDRPLTRDFPPDIALGA